MEASITFKSVAKKNKDETLLAELTFGVEKNTRFALVGPNGSGKSTILKLICGFIHKDKGSIYIKGFDADINSNQIKSIIGYMPQKSDFDQDLNIFENLSIYGQLYGMSSDDARKRIEYLAHKLNFSNYLKLHSIEIPCGVFKKLLLARALLHDPEILILDEPTTGLDPNQLVEIRNLIKFWNSLSIHEKKFGLVCGNRVKRQDSLLKKISSKLANRVRRLILDDDCNDTACALKVFLRSDYVKIQYFKNMHRFLPALFKMNGGKIYNIPVDDRLRNAGISKYSFNNRFWVGITDLIKVWILKKRRK